MIAMMFEVWPRHEHNQDYLDRARFFSNYRLRVAGISRGCGMRDRKQAPADGRAAHDPQGTGDERSISARQ